MKEQSRIDEFVLTVTLKKRVQNMFI